MDISRPTDFVYSLRIHKQLIDEAREMGIDIPALMRCSLIREIREHRKIPYNREIAQIYQVPQPPYTPLKK